MLLPQSAKTTTEAAPTARQTVTAASVPAPRRQPIARARNFNSASTNRLTAGWTTQARHPDELVKSNLKVLRARSREQLLNNDYMARFINLLVSNVVGPKGAVLQCRSKDSKGTLDKIDNDAVEVAFDDWSQPGNCETTGTLSFKDMQRLFITSVALDGEFIGIEHYNPHQAPHYQVELVDPVLLDLDHHNMELRNGNRILFSIEFDTQNRPINYYIQATATASDYNWSGKHYRKIPVHRVIHSFLPERIGQKRGFPMASTALFRMKMLEAYEDAAITAARTGASKMGFFTSPTGDGYTGDGTDTDGNTIMDMEAGVLEQLPEGVEFQAFDPNYPHQQFPEFVKTCLRGIGAGLNVSYPGFANDLEGVNFSSIRTGVLEDREAWKGLQEWMTARFNRRVYLNWLSIEILSNGGITNAAGVKLPPAKEKKYRAHAWQPRRWQWVDPLKDTNANIAAIDAGLKSRTEVIREQGREPEDVWTELELEKSRLEGLLPEATAMINEPPPEAKPDEE